MKTVQVSNGDFVVTSGGTLATVEGINKSGQDVARHLLSIFDPFFQEGNELIDYSVSEGSLSEGIASQFLTEAVNRLIIKQQNSGDDARIIKVNQIRLAFVGLTTLVFMVETLYSDGNIVTLTEDIPLKPVKLDHLLSESAFLNV